MVIGMEWLKIDIGRCLIEFALGPTDVITPDVLPDVVRHVYATFTSNHNCKLVKVTGRGPIWLYSAVVHVLAHLTPAVAVFDAVNKRWVVVSHSPEYQVGQVVADG